MPNKRIYAPNSILDVEQYIFYDFNEEFVLSNPNFTKLFNSCRKAFKSFDLSFKKDIPYFKMSSARCPFCNSRHVVKYGFTKRILVFKEIGRTEVKVHVIAANVAAKHFKQI